MEHFVWCCVMICHTNLRDHFTIFLAVEHWVEWEMMNTPGGIDQMTHSYINEGATSELCPTLPWKGIWSSNNLNLYWARLTGPDGAVAKPLANGLVGTGFASQYQLNPERDFKGPIVMSLHLLSL